MSQIPLQPRLDAYNGSDERKSRKAREHNDLAKQVVAHLHRSLARLPNGTHQFLWADIADETEIPVDRVREMVRFGGHNGITIAISDDERSHLSRYT